VLTWGLGFWGPPRGLSAAPTGGLLGSLVKSDVGLGRRMRKTAPTPMSARKANPPMEPPIIAPMGGELDASELVEGVIVINEVTVEPPELVFIVVDEVAEDEDDVLELGLLLDDVVEDDVLDELVVDVAVLNPVKGVKTLPSCPE
jgi:hypothetical protein